MLKRLLALAVLAAAAVAACNPGGSPEPTLNLSTPGVELPSEAPTVGPIESPAGSPAM